MGMGRGGRVCVRARTCLFHLILLVSMYVQESIAFANNVCRSLYTVCTQGDF